MINCKEMHDKIMKSINSLLEDNAHSFPPIDTEAKPKLGIINIINHIQEADDNIYIKNVIKDCSKLGIPTETNTILYDSSEMGAESKSLQKIEEAISIMGIRSDITGILVVNHPKKYNYKKIGYIHLMNNKDIDGFCWTPYSSQYDFPSTAFAAYYIAREIVKDVTGYNVCVVGRNLGLAIATLFTKKGATVTTCNSHTKNLEGIVRNSDIIITVTGKHNLIKADWVNENQIIIDVGIAVDENGKVCGDCEKEVYDKVPNSTPVPGGVGLITRAILMQNLVEKF